MEETYSYKYTMKAGDEKCTTGLQTFKTKKELCIGLQDNEKNNNCAVGLRSSRFSWDCEDKLGWQWQESVQCDVYVLKGRQLEFFLKKEDIISKTSYCVGRTESKDWEIVEEVKDEEDIYKGIRFAITLRTSSTKFKITRPDGLVSGETSGNNGLFSAHEEDLFSEDARLHVDCYKTYGCRNP